AVLLTAGVAWPVAAATSAVRPHRPRHRAAAPPPAAAAVGVPAAGATPLQQAVGLEVGREVRETSALGVHVVEVGGGDTVYTYNGDDARTIASNTKLFTTAAALDALGPGYLYETRLLLRGQVQEGVLRGDLGVIGSGDPNISGRAFDGDSYGAFRGWAHELAARGVRRVAGDLYLDDGLFEALQIHPDWPRPQLASWYEAPIAALSFNDNCVLVRVWPRQKSGLVRVETVPPVSIFQVTSTALTTNSRRRNHLTVQRREDRLIVAGSIYRESGPLEVWVTVPDPVRYFGLALVDALAQEGIEVQGRLRPVQRLPGPVWERVAVYRSSLLDSIRIANKRSQNFYAESLVKLLGARRCGDGSWSGGVRAVGDFLTGLGVLPGAFHMVDGSGLSREDRFTPRAVTQLLRHMYLHRWGAEFVQSLPSAGELESSLHSRLTGPPYRGNVFAKTGTIEGVSALSGYAKALSGKVYAFSILINRSRDVWHARQAQDRIVMALVDHG
ncbi:MAG TPA: D-alanyl-D-alanine carboxypeptidase/D-alanyl-D-alanine-endopeptidase, partial [Thermoanaerobaculia bacterium]|nr:D-alanyl-D-alanine carboxypeptidase/D-alanyl-D-alanine-endopeptidase [Thermoanaerobaculia bacterium]